METLAVRTKTLNGIEKAPPRHESLRDYFKAFGAPHGSTPTDRRTFGIDRLVWTGATRKEEGVPWYTGALLRAERFMASWHKIQEEASRIREVNRAAKALLVNPNLLPRLTSTWGFFAHERVPLDRLPGVKPTFVSIPYLLSGSVRGHPCCPATLTP